MISRKNGEDRFEAGKVLNFLADHALGLGDSAWFYKMFLGKGANSIPEARQSLQNAWWLSREDLLQTLHLMILENESLVEGSTGRLTMCLAVRLRDYLLYKERVFLRKDVEPLSGNESGSHCHFRDVFFTPRNLYDKYLSYLGKRFGATEISNILCMSRRNVTNELKRIKGEES